MRKRRTFSTFLSLLVVAVLGYGGYMFFKDMEGPDVTISPQSSRVSPEVTLTLDMHDISGIRSVVVTARKSSSSTQIFKKVFKSSSQETSVSFNLKDSGLQEGAFDLEVKVTDASLAGFGLGNTRTIVLPMQMDTRPPRVSVTTTPPYVRRGGSAVIRYTVNEHVQESGVRIGDMFFPGYLQADTTYLCYFAFPHMLTPKEYTPVITATDLAGNVTTNSLAVYPLNRKFKSDTIKITDNFLDAVSQRLYDLAPNAANPLERFLLINRDVRYANAQFLLGLAKNTAPTAHWSGSFTRLPRAASRAGYADHRTYVYNGQAVDSQYHLGFDLASLQHAEIPAANAGTIVFTGELGIYGKLVVIDHGVGLMSLYSHLSEISVAKGDTVKKGATIGRTGSTGMAFGDHLHFGVLVGGVEVTPLEWLDSKWIQDNITGRLTATP